MTTPTKAPVCLGDAVLLADVGNSRIKLAVVSDHGVDASAGRRLPTVTQRLDLDSHGFRPVNLENWLNQAAPTTAVSDRCRWCSRPVAADRDTSSVLK